MGLVRFFTFVVFIGGISRIYSQLSTYGVPKSFAEAFSSNMLLGAFLIGTAVGLFQLRPLARTFAKSLALLGIVGPIIFVIYLVVQSPTLMGGFAFVFLALQQYQTVLSSIAAGIIAILIGIGIYFIFCIFSYKALKGTAADEYFVFEDRWFDRDLIYYNLDFKVILSAILIVLLSFADTLMPKKLTKNFEDKKTVVAIQEIKKTFEQDPAYQKQQAQAQAYRAQDLENKKKVNLAFFTPDEKNLYLATSNQKLRKLNLLNYQQSAFDLKIESLHQFNFIERTGDYYYNDLKKSFIDTASNLSISPFGNANVSILGFGQNSTQVLIFNNQTSELSLFDFKSQKPIWSQKFASQGQDLANEIFWSTNHKWAFLGMKNSSFILDVDKGTMIPVKYDARYAEIKEFDPYDSWLMISGPLNFDQKSYSTILISIPSGEVKKIELTDKVLHYTKMPQRFWTHPFGKLKEINADSQMKEEASYDLGYSDRVRFSPDHEHILLLKESADQAELIKIKDHTRKFIGRRFDSTSRFSAGNSQAEWSKRGNLLVITNRKFVEIFWLSELLKENGKSYQFELDFN